MLAPFFCFRGVNSLKSLPQFCGTGSCPLVKGESYLLVPMNGIKNSLIYF